MNKFRVGDIIFYESTTFMGRIIRKITKCKYSHVAVAISSDLIVEANAFIHSRVIRFDPSRCKSIKIMRATEPITPEQKINLVLLSKKLINKGYDYKGIFLLLIKYIFRVNLDSLETDLTKLWCSELVDYMYTSVGIDLVPEKDNHYVDIKDILNSNKLKTIEIKKFNND